jgi:Rrf2 family transcriptional regulator, nitric oxide-sensitive transcriptional repressor
MQLTRHTDYALRVLLYLAYKGEELSTIREISDKHRISENHLMKVVNRLSKLGYVTALRGKGGGLRLARAPQLINVGEVIRDTEETRHVVECLAADYGGACGLTSSCTLKAVLKEAHAAFFENLNRYTLQDLAPKRPGAAALRFYRNPAMLQGA